MGSNWTLTLLTLMTTVFLSLGFSILSNDYLFGLMKYFPVFKSITHYDGPAEISNAPTDPTTTMLPTLEQMMYYNYYTSSMYCPYDLKNLSCEYCVKFKKDVNKLTVLRNDTHNTLALVTLSEKRKEIVVTYRGSTNFWNFFLDFYAIDMIDVETRTSALRGIKIHRGFYIATMSLYKDVVAAVGYLRSIKRRYAKYKLVICGHSLGGAMARVTQYFLHSLNQFSGVKLEVYTYGEFRSGNKAYVDYMNKLSDVTARIVSRADIIAHLPPTKALRSGDPYLHVQTEYFIDGKKGQRFCNQSMYEDSTCSMSLGPMYSALDHLIYFDTNVIKCVATNPQIVTALPFGIFEPTQILPPLPKRISNFLGGATQFVTDLLSPVFG